MQKAYGKTPDELETLVEGFAWALADYHMPKIMEAFKEYIKNHSDIPAPADIIKIITRQKNYVIGDNSIEALLRLHSKGIPLMASQKKILADAGF